MPRFSVVIPCFNAEATLVRTLDSILSQTCPDLEVICVDDGSTDGTRALITAAQARDPRVRLVRNTGKGPSAARNLGAGGVATGEIIAFCDADDLWTRDKLACLGVAFDTPGTDAVYGRVGFFRHHPDDARTWSEVPRGPLGIPQLLGENPVCTMSNLAVRRAAFLASGGFDAGVVHNEDLEWLIRLVGQGARVTGLDRTLTWYRASPDGLSADLRAMARGREAALRTAARFGHQPGARDQAVHLRYLARRALRLGHSRTQAARYALQGLARSPGGFFASPRRGALTLGGALAALVLPRRLSRSLFSR
jgi:glycosyltransferase involved in cell wall biosynthesis